MQQIDPPKDKPMVKTSEFIETNLKGYVTTRIRYSRTSLNNKKLNLKDKIVRISENQHQYRNSI